MRIRTLRSILLVALSSLAACTPPFDTYQRVNTSEEAGNVFVSASPAIAWTEISEKLQPQLNLSMAEARTLAATSTSSLVSQYLSSLSVGLRAGLPTRTSSWTTALAEDGSSTTTGQRTHAPGTVPDSSGTKATGIDNSSLAPDFSKMPANNAVDGNTLLSHAVALYQYAQILDNSISKSILPLGYRPYLITLQINQQPRLRNLPYDTFVDVALLPSGLNFTKQSDQMGLFKATPKSKTDKLPPVIAYPLVISDAMEINSVEKSLETIRQASLGISGMIQAIGVNAGVERAVDRLLAKSGANRNSLITVGRVSDSMLRIRLGAYDSGSGGLVMAARSYNISLMILVDESYEHLAINTRTEFVDVYNGSRLTREAFDREGIAQTVADTLCTYGFHHAQLACGSTPTDWKNEGEYKAKMNFLMNMFQNLEHGRYQQAFDGFTPPSDGRDADLAFRAAVTKILTRGADARNGDTLISLGTAAKPELPRATLSALADDDGKETVVSLREGKDLSGAKITAHLNAPQTGGKAALIVSANQIVFSDGVLSAHFPSLKTYGDASPANTQLTLCLGDKCPIGEQTYPVLFAKADDKSASTDNPVKASAQTIIADTKGEGLLRLNIGKLPDGVSLAYVSIAGAEFRTNSAAGTTAPVPQGIPVTANSQVLVGLGNLSISQKVTLTTKAGNQTLGSPISLAVATGKR